jgi:hypothetical protein
MADPVTITMVAIFATTIINAGVNTKFQNDQIYSLTDKIQTVTNQWATVTGDDQNTFDIIRESTVETLQTCQTLQQKTVSTQQTLRRQKYLLTLVSFIIVLTTGLSLFLKLLLRKQESGIKTNLDLTSYKFKK